MRLKTILICLFLSYVWLFPLYGLTNQGIDETQPVLYYADAQTYDRELGILILKGHVEFSQQGSILEADYVTYNENTGIVTASGNVRLRQADGDINFAEYVELTGDMKEGIIVSLRTLLEDNSKIAALEGRKFEDREELDQAVYTPCDLCGDKPPTWEISARRAVKDNVTNDIHFTDALFNLNIFNKVKIPFLYLPYVTQPLERRSGFLIPEPSYSTNFGALISIPYYLVLSEDKDATITPTFFTNQNPLLEGAYRQAFNNGFFKAEGSITDYKKSEKDKKLEKKDNFKIPSTRGHFFVDGKFNFNEIWRGVFSGGVVSDKTYFRKYTFSGWQTEANLTSKGILEGFLNQRDYAAAKVYHFQGLRNEDVQRHISAPLPIMEYSGYSGVDPWGGRFTFDGNLLNLTRKSGINMQRGIGEIGWQRPWAASFGQMFTVFGLVRGDLYKVENFHHLTKFSEKERKKGGARFFPQFGLDWRWPFVNSCHKQSYILQPLGQFILAPQKAIGIAAHDIPNEDSTDFQFNDANLFSPDRFPGYDRIDTGTRFVYGGQFFTTGALFGDIEVFLGQNYSFSKLNDADKHKHNHNHRNRHQDRHNVQGLAHRLSDYVGRIEVTPYSWLALNYRFRLDQKSFNPRVSEVGGSIGPAIAKLSGTYVFISKHARIEHKKSFNQINLTLTSQITQQWTLMGILTQNLNHKKETGGPLVHGAGLFYHDDCFGLGFTVKRQYFKDRDLRPSTIIMGTLFLKNVGDFNYAFNVGNGLLGEKTTEDSMR